MKYAVPTTVTASARGSVSAVSYPRGHNRKFDFSENTINVYEGRTAFNFNISVPAKLQRLYHQSMSPVSGLHERSLLPAKSKQITLTAKAN